MLTPQEFREQADLCIDRARTAGSAAERKLYRRLALTWLEIVIRIEPRAIELRDADAAALTVRTYARAGDQSRKNSLNRPGASASAGSGSRRSRAREFRRDRWRAW